MKRFLCPQHIHHLKTEGKSVLLSSEKCSICKYEKRPTSLKDTARQLEDIAISMRIAYNDPYYDPFGYSFINPLEETINKFLKAISPCYAKRFIETISKDVKLE